MEENTTTVTDTEESFGVLIGKTVLTNIAVSAASTVGMLAGVCVTGIAVQKFQSFKARRADDKATLVPEPLND